MCSCPGFGDNGVVAVMDFEEARACVIEQVGRGRCAPIIEQVPILEASRRVLAVDARADRDYPPVARSIRDGYAVRSEDLPGTLRIRGEIRAGEHSTLSVGPGEAVEIMTGATVPPGADAVVMVEHTVRQGDKMTTDREPVPGDFINPRGAECKRGETVVPAGRRLSFADIAMLATVGQHRVNVFRRPTVAILSTGDEIVGTDEPVSDHQVRNSNSHSLAVQVARAGGEPAILPIARDTRDSTRSLIAEGLKRDLLLLSGGVSAGKYDLVEAVLAEFGAEFFFDRVRIQPGQPLVFGRSGGTFFFGLPGNPASTMVTFEIFARAAVELLGGETAPRLLMTEARLTTAFRHKKGLTRFLPAELSDKAEVTPIPWQGSSDVPAVARADCFLVADSWREHWSAGDHIRVILK